MPSIAQYIHDNYNEYWGIYEYPADQCAVFSKAKEEWGILGNMTTAKIVIDGVELVDRTSLPDDEVQGS